MNADHEAGPAAENMSERLRLKRIFLIALVSSLATCTVIAVGVLLLGEFNDTTFRILGTLGVLAFHSAVAMVCAHTLERRRWPLLSIAGLILFGINFVVFEACIWAAGPDDVIFQSFGTTFALVIAYIVAIPCASLRERGKWLRTATSGLIACALAFALVALCIWYEPRWEIHEKYIKTAWVLSVIAISFGHTCLLGRLPGGLKLDWLLRWAILWLWCTGALASVMIIFELEDEFLLRIFGTFGVLDASGSLALVIMTRLRQVRKVEMIETADAQIEIHCPRCTKQQIVNVGASKCTACGLKFRIEIQEPRCAKCDYLLWNLTERRCPECGTPF